MSVDKELTEYTAKSGRSRVLHEEALAVMPGGNSRTTTFFDPYPFAIQRGQGAHIWDADGIDRLDFNGNYTSLILGHAPPDVVKAVQLARAFTGRQKIAKFEGAYHGTHDWVMVSVSGDAKATGSRKRPKPVAWSAGIPPAVLKHTVVLPWNDAEACAEILEAEASQLACLIIDPMMCNAGLIPPAEGFLARLREITERHNIVLIFDEVISFRTAWGGAQERFSVRPDLTTFGKIIGGGLPVGAFGGRRDIMDFYDPRKGGARISHGGTFNANPVTMAAGLATLNALTPDAYARLDALGERLRGGVARLLAATRRRGQVTGLGSLFWLHWTSEPLSDYRSARPKDGETPVRVFLGLLNEGILLTQRGLGACSVAMTDEDVDRFINALARVLARG
jgi:glutamate-1-semialdehyde 2,1-aminomutase